MTANGEGERFVLDSFALFAHFEDEADGPVVRELLTRARHGGADLLLSVINLGEAVYITERERGLPLAERLIAAVDALPITIVDADRQRSLAAAHLKARYRIAYADAFALSLAMEAGATLLTGDPEFATVGEIVPIRWLRRA